MRKWTGGYFYTQKNVQFENVSLFIKVSEEEKFLLFQHGEINGKSGMLSYWYAWCKKTNSWFMIILIQIGRLRYVNEVWSVTITMYSFPNIGKSKELDYVRKSAHEVIKWFKSSTIILSQSVWSIWFTATMEMGTFHLWGTIELSILDQFWQMRCQNYCD